MSILNAGKTIEQVKEAVATAVREADKYQINGKSLGETLKEQRSDTESTVEPISSQIQNIDIQTLEQQESQDKSNIKFESHTVQKDDVEISGASAEFE